MAAPKPGSRVGSVPLEQVPRKDLCSVTPRGLRVDEAIEREVLEILQQAVLTPATLERLLTEVNARLRAQAAVSRPRIKELRKALTLVDREITNYTRAIAKGDFSSLEQALAAAEQRRVALQAELAQLDGSQQPAVIQLDSRRTRTAPSRDDRETAQWGERESARGDPAVIRPDSRGRRRNRHAGNEAGWTAWSESHSRPIGRRGGERNNSAVLPFVKRQAMESDHGLHVTLALSGGAKRWPIQRP